MLTLRPLLTSPDCFCLLVPFRKAHLILRRLERVSSHCSSLLRSAYIQSRVDTIPYLFCRSEEVRPAGMVWYSILKDTKITCEEKMVSMARNTYGETKGRWGRVLPSLSTETLLGEHYFHGSWDLGGLGNSWMAWHMTLASKAKANCFSMNRQQRTL